MSAPLTRARAALALCLGLSSCTTDARDAGPQREGFSSPAACESAPACAAPLSEASACGGAPLGSYALCSACSDPSLLAFSSWEECPEIEVTLARATPSQGALSLADDGSYALSLQSEVALAFVLPASCTVGEQCEVGRPEPFLEDSACERLSEGQCDCTGTASQRLVSEGSFAVNGGVLTLTPADQSPTLSAPFCVAEDGALSLSLPGSSGRAGAGLVFVPAAP